MRSLLFAGAMVLSLPAFAQAGWRTADGGDVPETSSTRSAGGFGATLLITPDKDWQQKWDTPPETSPSFSRADSVEQGGELYILTFLTNPGLDAEGMADVVCDIRMERPDGTASTDEHAIPCFQAKLETPPTRVYMTSVTLGFIAEPTDPLGTWTAYVTVKDRVRGVSLPLEATFEVR